MFDPGPTGDDDVIEAVAAYMRQMGRSNPPGRDEFLSGCPPELRAEINRAIEQALHIDGLLMGDRFIDSEPHIFQRSENRGTIAPLGFAEAGLLGAVFDDYQLTRWIGRGGMGVVYEGQLVETRHALTATGPGDVEVGIRRTAVKLIRGNAGELAIKRFCREAEATLQLHHPHIVPVYRWGQSETYFYYVMKFASGGTIVSWLSELRGESTDRRMRRIAAAVAQADDGLQYAHDRGILHRDVKPTNLLVEQNGTVMLADFGLTRRIDDETLTATGDLVGTLRYLPPEAFDSGVDYRSDIYALGATLFELLHGRPLHDAQEPILLMRSITHRLGQSVKQINPSLPRPLVGIIDRAVHPNPARRYVSAAAMADDLRRFASGQRVHAVPIGRLEERLMRWVQNPAALKIAAILLAVLVAVAVAGPLLAVRFRRLASDIQTARSQVEHSLQELKEESRRRQHTLLQSWLSDAESRTDSGRIGQHTESLELISQAMQLATNDPSLRSEVAERWNLPWEGLIQRMYFAAISKPDLQLVHRWSAPHAADSPVAFSGDLMHHIRHDYTPGNHRLVIFDTLGNMLRQVAMPDEAFTNWIGWCARAKKVCLTVVRPDHAEVWIWDLTTDEFRPTGWRTTPTNKSTIVEHTGELIYLAENLQLCRVSLIDHNAEPAVLMPPQSDLNQFISAPDGRHLAVHYHDRHSVDLIDLETEQIETLALDQSIDCLAWRPDGRCLAVSGDTTVIYDLATHRPLHRQPNRHGLYFQMVYSADGKMLFCNGRRGFMECWDATLSTSLLRCEMIPVTLSTDGSLMALSQPDGFEIRRPITPLGVQIISLSEGDVREASFMRGDEKVALSHSRGVRVFDLATQIFSANHDFSDGPFTPLEPSGASTVFVAKERDLYTLDSSDAFTDGHLDSDIVGAPDSIQKGLHKLSFSGDGSIWSLAYDATRNRIAVLTHPPFQLSVHQLPTGRVVWTQELDFNSSSVRFDERGDRYVVSTFAPGICRVLDAANGQNLFRVDGFRADLIGCPTKGKFVIQSGGNLRLLEASASGYLYPSSVATYDADRYPLGDFASLVTTRDGRLLATESRRPRGCLVVNVETLQPLKWLRGDVRQPESRPLAFSSDGRYLVTERGRTAVAVWDLKELAARLDAFVGTTSLSKARAPSAPTIQHFGQPQEGTHVPLAGGRGRDAKHIGRFHVAESIDVTQE
ncbi:Serine/threonine-protein kinase PrkC [Allorhodopirellula heiligendammensis]|uniref:Serine/threonine-protein kinase PrkC n=1 Tax=Allorhodopirellula heiligendammensis TaxID=2714739 RepID=A0A5C6BU10_9BACT|nr:Serine/threonine-protein kinase PrkC [Allorhodopirellula heiligendammensis]